MKKKVKIVAIVFGIIVVAIVAFFVIDFLLRKSGVESPKKIVVEQYESDANGTIKIMPQPLTQEDIERSKKIEQDRQIPWEVRKDMSFDKVSVSVKEESVTKNGATFIITNNNVASCAHGYEYKIERRILGIWVPVCSVQWIRTVDEGWFTILSQTNKEHKIDWNERYGALQGGKYRLGEEIFINGQKQYIYAEFSI